MKAKSGLERDLEISAYGLRGFELDEIQTENLRAWQGISNPRWKTAEAGRSGWLVIWPCVVRPREGASWLLLAPQGSRLCGVLANSVPRGS